MCGQVLVEGALQMCRVGTTRRGHHVRHQPAMSGEVLARYDHCFDDSRHGADARLDLGGFDAIAPDLDLVVASPDELEITIGEHAHLVARAVEAGASRLRERVRDERVGGGLREVQVAPPDRVAADEQLPGHAIRDRSTVLVEHVQLGVPERAPDRH